VLARLSGRPLAIAPRALDRLLAAGLSINARSAIMPDLRVADPAATRGFTMTDGGIAIVPVLGPLVTRGDWLTTLFGATSYGKVAGAVEAAFAEPLVRAVLLELDSPGGEVGGLFDLVDRLASLRDEAGKPLWAVASESALSAAFAIASVADRLYVTRTAEVGSVGVVAIHVDESAADAMVGLEWTLIHAGAKKVDGNPHEPLSAGAHADIQADVDALHAELVALVARNRDLTTDAVRATQAAIYRGQRGIEVKFADRLGTVEQAIADLAATINPRPQSMGATRRARTDLPARREPDMNTDTNADLAVEHPGGEASAPAAASQETPQAAAATDVPASPEPAAEDAAARLRAEYAEIASIAAQAARLGVAVDAADAMARGIEPDALRRTVLDTLAARAEAAPVVAAAPQPIAGDSPIVRRARERAAASRN
jgi:ClpP class serine protease